MNTNRLRLRFCLTLLLLASATSLAADDPVAALSSYNAGQNSAKLTAVENAVRAALVDPAAARAMEARLAAVLDGSAAPEAKDFVCRQLRVIGTAQSVPALAKLLGDERLSSIARYALQAIPDATAGDALRAALKTVTGGALVGMANSVGERREADSVPALVPLLENKDPAVVDAAVAALGKIGGPDALDALRAVASNYEPSAADGGLRNEVKLTDAVKAKLNITGLANAVLQCAEGFAQDGDPGLAGQIYARVAQAERLPKAPRLAALRGLTVIAPAEAAPFILELLKGDDAGLRVAAIGMARQLPGESASPVVGALDQLPTPVLPALIAALANRHDATLVPALLKLARHDDAAVRLAALQALGMLEATAESAKLLLQAAATGQGAEREGAREALRRARGAAMDVALAEAIRGSNAGLRAEAIRVAAPRGARTALPELLRATADPDQTVRIAALEALASLADADQLPVILERLGKAADSAERDAAVKAAVAAARARPDAKARATPLIAALGTAPPEAKVALLGALAELGGANALAAVSAAAKDGDAKVRGAAIGALAGWPDASAMDALIAIARSTDNPTHRIVALRGFLQQVEQPGRTPEQALAFYQQALAVADRAEEKKLVLAGLSTVSNLAALKLAEPFLADAALKDEAGLAVAKIALGVANAAPEEARAAATQVQAAVQNPAVLAQAKQVTDYLERFEDFVNTWMLAGPFTKDGAKVTELFDVVFPPETPGAVVAWRPARAVNGLVPLDQLIGGENRVAYLRTTIVSPKAEPARLEIGSDDGVKVWLNGRVVHANNVDRGYVAGQDKVAIELKEGANVLLVKVTQGGGGWTMGCRLRAEDGGKLAGWQAKAE
jgi:HEAT repeat protein